MDEAWDDELTIDIAFIDQLSLGETGWGNIYLNADADIFLGVETYFTLTETYESRRDVPVLIEAPPRQRVEHADFTQRSSSTSGTTFVKFWLRLDDIVIDETIEHFTALDCFNSIGGAQSFFMMVFGVIFVTLNR